MATGQLGTKAKKCLKDKYNLQLLKLVMSAETKVEKSTNAEALNVSPANAKPLVARSLNVSNDIYLKNYLHFYIGGTCRNVENGEEFKLTPKLYLQIIEGQLNALPVLYNFWTLPITFWEKLKELNTPSSGCFMSNSTILNFMFASQYDFFGLTELGLAFLRIDTDLGKKVYKEQTFEWSIEPKPSWFYEVPKKFCQTAITHKILPISQHTNHL